MRLAESDRLAKFSAGKKIFVRRFEISDASSLNDALEFIEAETLFGEKRGAIAKVTGWNAEMSSVFQKHSSEISANANRLLIFLWLNHSLPAGGQAGPAHNVTIEEFPALEGKYLQNWIRETAMSFGNTLGPQTISALITLHGSNTESIWHDLVTLSCWKPNSKIEEKDLAIFHTELPKPEAFALLDALMQGNKKQGFEILEYALANGEEPHIILGALINLFRALLVASAAEGNRAAVKKFFAGRHPYWVSRIMKNARHFTHEELRKQFLRLYQADIAIKTGKMDPAMAIERAVIGI